MPVHNFILDDKYTGDYPLYFQFKVLKGICNEPIDSTLRYGQGNLHIS